MSVSDAWLLECGDSLSIAVGDHEMLELLNSERCDPLPGSPGFCAEVLQRNGEAVPVVDLEALCRDGARHSDSTYLCLLYDQKAPGQPLQQVALRVENAPERIQVDDAQICEFPQDYEQSLIRNITLSCFTHHARPVLVLDISSLCSDEFRELARA